MTYSIVARDGVTGDLGVGVQTCMFAVGSIVPGLDLVSERWRRRPSAKSLTDLGA
jgi:hypothetical protein